MASKMITAYDNFTPESDVSFTKPSANKAGGKSVGILHKDSRKALYLTTPLMLTWGLNDYDQANGGKSYDMSLQFPRDEYTTRETTEFLEVMKSFEANIKAAAVANPKEWFGKSSMSAEVIDALWTPMLKYPKNQDTGDFDYERAPTLRVKLPFWEGEWKTELYDTEQNCLFPGDDDKTPIDFITKQSHIACVVQCGGVWFANGKFGVTWRLLQGVVKPQETLRGKCHIFLNAGEKEKLSTPAATSDNVVEENAEVDTDGEDAQEEVEEDDAQEEEEEVEEVEETEEVEPEPVVEPIKKKKVVRKKKV